MSSTMQLTIHSMTTPDQQQRSVLRQTRNSALTFIAVIALHLALVTMLLTMKVINVPQPLASISVSLIQATTNTRVTPQTERHGKPAVLRSIAPTPTKIATQTPDSSGPGITLAPDNGVSPAPTVGSIVHADATESPPRFDADYLDNPVPRYPSVSKRLREQGVVILRVHVEANGLPAEIQLHRSSGYATLDDAAIAGVRRWRFVPARRGNDAIAAWVLVPVAFNIKE